MGELTWWDALAIVGAAVAMVVLVALMLAVLVFPITVAVLWVLGHLRFELAAMALLVFAAYSGVA